MLNVCGQRTCRRPTPYDPRRIARLIIHYCYFHRHRCYYLSVTINRVISLTQSMYTHLYIKETTKVQHLKGAHAQLHS